ncbi:MAG: hypothetical protein Q8Q36_00575 [bacterium]|nr:hypothetical protein [bacterium]
MEFTREQVAALCGGRFPETNGFDWSRVGHFRLEDGVLQPYAFDQILPGPGLKTTVKETGLSDEEWNKAEQVLDMARRLEALHPYFPEETNGDLDRRGPQQGKKPEETEQFRKDFFQLFRVEGYPPNGKWFRFDRPYKLFVRGGTFTNASLLAEFGRRCRSLGIEITVYVEFR